jgi:FixJ family two-component response regulator
MDDWQTRALCAQVDPDLWFPEKGASSRPARRICQRCPVQPQCLADALARGERHGVWGGLNEKQLRGHDDRTELVRQIESAREHERVITSLPKSDAARELGISERTVERWRRALRKAS